MRKILSLSCSIAMFLTSIAGADLKDDLVGAWVSKPVGGVTISFVLNADGTGTVDGDPIRWALAGSVLSVTDADKEVEKYTIATKGAAIIISEGDLDAPTEFTRLEAAPEQRPTGAAKQEQSPPANPLVGKWNSTESSVVMNADGTGTLNGNTFRYVMEGTDTIVITDADGTVLRYQFSIDGDRLSYRSETGEAGILQRAVAEAQAGGAKADANGVAGVYVAQESSIDPTNAMVLTQYLILYSDGAVGWSKSEMGATREAVGQAQERFSMFKNGQGDRGKIYGRWESSGGRIVVQWNIWNNLRCEGVVNAGEIQLEKMGTLNEGATLKFSKR